MEVEFVYKNGHGGKVALIKRFKGSTWEFGRLLKREVKVALPEQNREE